MQQEEPNWPVDSSEVTDEMRSVMRETTSLAFNPNAGYHSTPSLIKDFMGVIKNRMAFDVVEPHLVLEQSIVQAKSDENGKSVVVCNINDPLISQFIALKPFLCPENAYFFAHWLREIKQKMSSPQGIEAMFGPSDQVEEWFSQELPIIDMANPVKGALQTLQLSRMGM